MEKKYKLIEISAVSAAGDNIIVEQIYEKERVTDLTTNEKSWIPLSKIVIVDKVIDLSEDNSFTHPSTGRVFRLL
ncbi:hypothetical protein [Acinetobacter haemolyticus]|uniref:hypothetical protein n=1 Tax=Acinetobacter haemolyticus TaxID=29430 RepID=UPI001372A725|nr:hypothetical protein [Acinetobacter haemolyticus]NAS10115.1 hypothetical protein [Acinetobacter haemolyticus]